MSKKYFHVLILVAVVAAFASCQNTVDTVSVPEQKQLKPPVTQPLKFSGSKKINWAAIKAVKVNPVSQSFSLDKIPEVSYDTSGFKPFKYPVEQSKFDYNALPEKDMDIAKLPSRPLKFKTYILPPPKLIKAGQPALKNAQTSLFKFGDVQGLKAGTISHSFTDREGFVWVYTDKGLYRYDGENFWLYDGLSANTQTNCMLEDSLGRIWIGLNDGKIEVIDTKNGLVKIAPLSNYNLIRLLLDDHQRIWVATWTDGVNIIDPKTQTFKSLGKPQGLSDQFTVAIVQDKQRRVWIGTDHGLDIIDLENKKIRYADSLSGLKSNQVNGLLYDKEGRLWIGFTGGMINVIDFQKKSIQTIKEANKTNARIYHLLEDNNGYIWIGDVNNGIELIDLQNQQSIQLIKTNILNGEGKVAGLSQDNRGQVWIAEWTELNLFANNKAIAGRIGEYDVNSLVEDHNGLIWQNTTTIGVDIIDRKTKTIKHLSTRQGLSNDTILQIQEIKAQIFITTNNGLDIIDSLRHTITHFYKKQCFNDDLVYSFAIDKAGNLFTGTRANGIFIYNPRNKTIKHVDASDGRIGNFVYAMLRDSDGNIWATSEKGIEMIDAEKTNINYLATLPGMGQGNITMLNGNMGNTLLAIYTDLYIVDAKNKTLTVFGAAQGLPNEDINSVNQDNGKIYVSTSSGMTVITPTAGGANDNEFWPTEFFGRAYLPAKATGFTNNDLVTRDGLFWWGASGITVLDISKRDTFKSSAFITGINIMDRPVYFVAGTGFNVLGTDSLWGPHNARYLKGEIPLNTGYAFNSGLRWDKVAGPYNMPVNLQLPHDQNFIQFHYGSLNLAKHDTIWYNYRLVGADDKWSSETNATSTHNYINLTPGRYTFEVVSKSADNTWSAPAAISFTINPPWWQTWWAYILYTCLFAGSIWGFSYYRSLQLIKEKRILEHKVHIRTEEVMQQKEEIESQRDNLEIQRNDLEITLNNLKTAQTQLIQSEKMASLGELTAGIAHEIQNPLNFVNNFSEVNTEMIDELEGELKSGNIDEALAIAADIKQNELKIYHHGQRADSIVKGMLEHSRSRSGQKEPTNINNLADEYMRLSYHGLRAKDKTFNSELTTNFDGNLPKINVVQQDIGRVLLNLFNNAFYATNQKAKTTGGAYKSEVTVTTELFAPPSGDRGVVIKVKDNGIGIPDAIKEKIMQPFFTTKPTGEGTGLGLSLTYDMVVKGHGGSIKVESKEGEGSEFKITLPLG